MLSTQGMQYPRAVTRTTVHRNIDYRTQAGRLSILLASAMTAVVFGLLVLFIASCGWEDAPGPIVVAFMVAVLPWSLLSAQLDRCVLVTSERIVHTQTSSGWLSRRRRRTVLDVRWDAVDTVEDIARRESPDDLHPRHELRIGKHIIRDSDLGCEGRKGRYAELVATIRDAIGDRLVERSYLNRRAPKGENHDGAAHEA